MTPPVWKSPLVEEMRSVASGRVSSSKYEMNEGCPTDISRSRCVVFGELTKGGSNDRSRVSIS